MGSETYEFSGYTEAQCLTMANAILLKSNVNISIYRVTYVQGKDVMFPCEQCDFAYNREPYNVVSAKHFIGEVVYEGVHNLLVSAALSDKFPYIQKTILGNVDVNTTQIDATQAIVATKTTAVEAVAAIEAAGLNIATTKEVAFVDGTATGMKNYVRSMFEARQSTAYNVLSVTLTLCPFSTQITDLNGDYTPTTTYDFTAPKDGIYFFRGSVLFNSYTWAAGDKFQLRLYVDGTIKAYLDRHTCSSSYTDNIYLHGTYIIELSAGEKVDLRVASWHASTVKIRGDSVYNIFSGYWVMS